MTIYSILFRGNCEEAYNKAEFEKMIFGPFCKKAIEEQGYATCLKQNAKSRRWGSIINDPDGGLEILWEALEREKDGAY